MQKIPYLEGSKTYSPKVTAKYTFLSEERVQFAAVDVHKVVR